MVFVPYADMAGIGPVPTLLNRWWFHKDPRTLDDDR